MTVMGSATVSDATVSDLAVSDLTANSVTERLTLAERDRRSPNMRPKDAATLILLDRSGRTPRVLMGRRHPSLRFMPGAFVFPGGRIEPGDRSMRVAGSLSALCEARLMARVGRPSALRARALALAAIRETFEETGLMIGSGEYGAPQAPPGTAWQAFAEAGIYPDLEGLTFVARAITPPKRPRRFDTRFFTADHRAIGHSIEGVVGDSAELVELRWVTFPQAYTLALPTITRVILEEVERRLAAGFGPHLPVPFYYEVRKRFRREEL